MIGPERCKVGEALFNPSVLNISSPGLADLVFQSIEKCPEELRQELLRNIVIGGAVGQMSGVGERLTQDLKALLASTNYKDVKVVKLPEAQVSHTFFPNLEQVMLILSTAFGLGRRQYNRVAVCA